MLHRSTAKPSYKTEKGAEDRAEWWDCSQGCKRWQLWISSSQLGAEVARPHNLPVVRSSSSSPSSDMEFTLLCGQRVRHARTAEDELSLLLLSPCWIFSFSPFFSFFIFFFLLIRHPKFKSLHYDMSTTRKVPLPTRSSKSAYTITPSASALIIQIQVNQFTVYGQI